MGKKIRKDPEVIIVDEIPEAPSVDMSTIQGTKMSLESAKNEGLIPEGLQDGTGPRLNSILSGTQSCYIGFPNTTDAPNNFGEVPFPDPNRPHVMTVTKEPEDPQEALEIFVNSIKKFKENGIELKVVDHNKREVKGLEVIIVKPKSKLMEF